MSASRSSEAQGDAHLLGEWARLVFATLQASGVRDVWVSPGSRSTPFVWAALHSEGLTVRSVVDERSAAFLALGHARVSGRPSALLCTSGTAAANYFPAVVEASLAHLPLVVLTADRPLDVQHAAAAQTIDQVKLYGDHARAFFDLGLPDAAPSALSGARRIVAQAVAQSQGPLPGPVHLNLRARKPLEPTPASNDIERELTAQITRLLGRPLTRHAPEPGLANEAVLAAARTVAGAASGCIVLGPLPAYGPSLAEPIAELAGLTGFPIFAEASSQLRFALGEHELSYPLFDWLLSAPSVTERLRPELVICIGQTPTSSAYERWVARVPQRIVLADHGYPDALGTATLVASGNLSHALTRLTAALGADRPPSLGADRLLTLGTEPSLASNSTWISNPSSAPEMAERLPGTGKGLPSVHQSPSHAAILDWKSKSSLSSEQGVLLAALKAAHEQCRLEVERAVAAEGPLSEGAAVKSVVESMPEAAVLALGNSLPIRDVDAYVTRAARLRVVSQRGANGIDGLVSGAIGSAIGSGAPTLLLIGDVSLLHDLGGLASCGLVSTPLVIAVVDNAGGRIFDQLPVQQLYGNDAKTAALWLTPGQRDLSHAAALFGLRYEAPTTPAEVAGATSDGLSKAGTTLLHLRVGADSAANLRRKIVAALSADVGEARD